MRPFGSASVSLVTLMRTSTSSSPGKFLFKHQIWTHLDSCFFMLTFLFFREPRQLRLPSSMEAKSSNNSLWLLRIVSLRCWASAVACAFRACHVSNLRRGLHRTTGLLSSSTNSGALKGQQQRAISFRNNISSVLSVFSFMVMVARKRVVGSKGSSVV